MSRWYRVTRTHNGFVAGDWVQLEGRLGRRALVGRCFRLLLTGCTEQHMLTPEGDEHDEQDLSSLRTTPDRRDEN